MNKILSTILKFSLSSLFFGGCVSSDFLKKKDDENIFYLKDIPIQEGAKHYHFSRSFYQKGRDIYKSDLLFVLDCAKKCKKEYFEFDGSVYRADDSAILQLDALVKARQKGKKTFIYQGKERRAVSRYEPDEQIKIFGNLWKEVSSPQSEETKKILRKTAEYLAPFPAMANSVLNKLYDVCRVSGYPEIKDLRYEISLMGRVIKASTGDKKSYFSPSVFGRSSIFISPILGENKRQLFDYSEVLIELAHAFRDKNNMFGETSQFLADGFKDIFKLNSVGFGSTAQLKNYTNPQRMEYDAHKIVYPALLAYVKSPIMTLPEVYNKIETQRKENGNTYVLSGYAKKKLNKTVRKQDEIPVRLFGYRHNFPVKVK